MDKNLIAAKAELGISLPVPYMVLGSGGHAKILIDLLRSRGSAIVGCLDADSALWGKEVEGVPILGGVEILAQYPPKSILPVNGVGAIRSNLQQRREVFKDLQERGFDLPPIVASNAQIALSATIGKGHQILTRAVVQANVHVGDNVAVGTGAILQNNCTIADHVFLCSGVILCEATTIDEGCFLGTGAVVLPNVHIGAGTVVSVGAIVHRDVAPCGVALGTAARHIRREGRLQ